MNPALDQLRRPLEVLRISVTDRCNLRCQYCMPAELFGEHFKFLPRTEVLSFEEIRELASAFVKVGVRRFRITGGEPLLRRDLPVLVGFLHDIDPSIDIALTTNGFRLVALLPALMQAGLNRVNISMDALDPEVASTLAGRTVDPESTWKAILAARDAGLTTKVNAVIKRDFNEGEILPLVERCRDNAITLRFIEYMDVGTANDWSLDKVVTGREVRERIRERWALVPVEVRDPSETATRFVFEDGSSEVGFIDSVSAPFCRGCNRARISAAGDLYTCLFASTGVSLKNWLREENLSGDDITKRLVSIWNGRHDRYSEKRYDASAAANRQRPEMWTVGG